MSEEILERYDRLVAENAKLRRLMYAGVNAGHQVEWKRDGEGEAVKECVRGCFGCRCMRLMGELGESPVDLVEA